MRCVLCALQPWVKSKNPHCKLQGKLEVDAIRPSSKCAKTLNKQLAHTLRTLSGEGVETEHGTCEEGDFFCTLSLSLE
eukprot:COSAG05_NODE_5438_length_1173_cov_112.770950_1_plen_78_part_00